MRQELPPAELPDTELGSGCPHVFWHRPAASPPLLLGAGAETKEPFSETCPQGVGSPTAEAAGAPRGAPEPGSAVPGAAVPGQPCSARRQPRSAAPATATERL